MTETATTDIVTIVANGEHQKVPRGQTLISFLADRGLDPDLVVVERNGEIVSRQKYTEVRLEADDVLEIVHFVGGG